MIAFMRTKPTDIGLVGCGNWGRLVLRDLVSLGCRVSVVAPSEATRKRALAEGAAAALDSVAKLPSVDGVLICVPSSLHARILDEVLPLGKPVFVEKPLTCDAASAERFAAAAPDRLFVMDKWRYHPGVEALAALARSGELGPVLGVRTRRLQWGTSHGDVNALWTLAPHDLAIALEILGTLPAPRAAVAEVLDGVPVGMNAVLGTRPWVSLEISTRSREHRREVQLQCEGGVAVLADGYSKELELYRGAPPEKETKAPAPERRPFSEEFPLLRELRAFVGHVEGGPPPRSSAADGARIVRLISELLGLAGA